MVAAVVAAAATVGAEAVGAWALGQTFTFGAAVLARAAFSAGIALVGEALARPNAPAQAPAFQTEARGRTHVLRASAEPRRVVYGRVMTSGTLVYGTTSGAKKEYLHLVVAIAGHQVQEIGDIYLNDEKLGSLDGAGNVTTGRFAGYARVKKYLGDPNQVADPDLIAEAPNGEWTSAHRLRGVAYIYLRLKWSQDVFPTGIPNPKAIMKGKNDILDIRTNTTGYTVNAALCVLDYIRWPYGFDCAAAETDAAAWIAAANVCDENVYAKPATSITSSSAGNPAPVNAPAHGLRTGDTAVIAGHSQAALNGAHVVTVVDADNLTVPVNLATGGTGGTIQLQQKRYTCNGSFTLDSEPPKILEDLRSAMGGACIYAMGKWYGYAGAAATPTVTLTEKDLRAPLKYRPRPSRRDLFNAVRGTYVNPENYWQQTDFPPITNATYEAQDGNKRYYRDVQLPFTTDVYAAQRLGWIELRRHRGGRIAVEFPAKITAMRLFVWRPVYVSIAELGWSNKPFRVSKWKYAEDGGVDLVLESFDSATYDWVSSDAQLVVAPRDTNLPNPFNVAAPTNLVLASGTAELDRRLDGTIFSRIKATWTAPNDIYVTSGGSIELQFKKSSDSVWRQGPPIRGDETSAWILDVQDGVAYDVQISSVNSLGVRSVWVTVAGYVVLGKSANPADVTGFSAQQSENNVNFRCDPNNEADVLEIEIRYNPQGDKNWDSATPVAKILKGLAFNSGVVPPGSWTLLAKAKDTSKNYSQNAATFDLDVANTYDVVQSAEQAPSWPGQAWHFIRHPSGALIPDSTKPANQHTRAELFEQFVPYRQPACTYEAPAFDLGFDADEVRVWGVTGSALGRGVTSGVADPQLQIDYRKEAYAYDGFEPWTIGAANFRRLKARVVLGAESGAAKITSFKPVCDVKEITLGEKDIAVPAGGMTRNFPQRFHFPPRVIPGALSSAGAARYANVSSVTETGFHLDIFDATGANVGGNGGYDATGV